MMQEQNSARTNQTINDLRELIGYLWQFRLLISISGFSLSLVAFGLASVLPNKYVSEATTIPVKANGQGQLGSLLGQFGGLASMAGLDLPLGGGDQTQIILETLNSRQFVNHFINKHDLKPVLFAGLYQHAETSQWEYDPSIYDSNQKKWTRVASYPFSAEPGDFEVYSTFVKSMLIISHDKKTGILRIAIKLRSPIAARDWVDWYVADLNEWMREKTIDEKHKTITYLVEQAEKTEVKDMQTLFYTLIQKEQTELMLAKTQTESALKTIDPAIISPIRDEPKRGLMVSAGGFLGVFVSMTYVLFILPLIRKEK